MGSESEGGKGKKRKGSGAHERAIHSGEVGESDMEEGKLLAVYMDVCIEKRRNERMKVF